MHGDTAGGAVTLGRLVGDVVGNGPTVVVLHGNGGSRETFTPMLLALTARRRVVALDSRAHGQTPRGDGPLTIDRCADDLATAVDALNVDQVDLVGYSDGGNIALTYAISHPDRVRSLVTYGANLDPAGLLAPIRLTLNVMYVGYWLLGLLSPRARARAELVHLMTHQPHIDPHRLASVTAPALIAAGQHDMVRAVHTQLIADALPQGHCLIVPGASHSLPMADPHGFARLVLDFLDSPDRPTRPSSDRPTVTDADSPRAKPDR